MGRLSERIDQLTPLQRAVFALKETQARLETVERARTEPIAIVGMACRFPGGADSLEEYWKLLCDGVDAIREVPRDRWDVDAYYDPDPMVPGKTNSRWGGFLDGIDRFDRQFFGISEREAVRMDPQQRLMLELAWEALEDAGLPAGRLAGSRTGVFIGIAGSDYCLFQVGDPLLTDAFASTGTSICIAANRVSFVLDLHGPSVALDTACSSSLVAIHQACQSLRAGESTLAIAGGVNVMLCPTTAVNLTKAGLSSPDGRCRSFDAGANGYVRSEGGGLIVLKPLAAALADGDAIRAVIRGTAVNQDGQSNGMKTPNRQAQESLVREAHAQGRTAPGRVGYVEAQGTGTLMGDMIEARALGNVLAEGRPPDRPCFIGSVKTNIGHLETASGVAGVIKTVLALEHRAIPGNLHYRSPNPHVPFGELPIRVADRLTPWPDASDPALAGVSALGFGGTNAHIVLEEAPAPTGLTGPGPAAPVVIPLSARSPGALRDHAAAVRDALAKDDAPGIWDVAWTAAVRRDHHDHRVALVARSPAEAAALLDSYLQGESHPDLASGQKPHDHRPRAVFLFTPDLAAWRSAGRALLAQVPAFPALLADLDETVRNHLGWSLRSLLEAPDEDPRWVATRDRSVALAALQVAVASLWRAWGIQPDAVMGTGVGEVAAACVAGALSIDDAIRVASFLESGRSESVNPRASIVPILSAVDGREIDGRELTTAFWAARKPAPECLPAALGAIAARQADAILEIGPRTLSRASLRNHHAAGVDRRHLASIAAEGEPLGPLLQSLAALYSTGHAVSWERVWPGRGRLVRLPSYPWQRERCWLEAASNPAGTVLFRPGESAEVSPPSAAPALDGIFELRWEQASAVSAAERPEETPARRRRWLVLGDGDGIADRLADRLAAQDVECVVIAPRPFDDPGRVAADALGEDPAGWERIVHVSSLDVPAAEELTLSDLAPARSLTGDSLLALVRGLPRSLQAEGPRLWAVTRGVHSVDGSAATSPAQAPVWGLGRTLAQEHPGLWGGAIDLDPAASAEVATGQLCSALLDCDGEDQVAWRNGARHVARLIRHEPARVEAGTPLFRSDCTYLVTGGLGSLAQPLARWLVERGARRLILMGRTEIPPRATWGKVDPGTSLGRKIAAVRELEGLGASIHLAAVDVGDERQLSGFLETFRAEGWPPIRGVFHLAGTSGLKPLLDITADDLSAQLRPKLAGAWLLHRMLEAEPLELFVLFSSATSILGAPMLGGFAAANASLDALAAHRRSLGRHALVVNWGAWQSSVAAARPALSTSESVVPRATRALEEDRALAILGRLIGEGAGQAVVLPHTAEDWIQHPPIPLSSPILRALNLEGATARAAQPRPELTTPYEAPTTDLERWLASLWAEILRVDRVGIHDNFFELGGDSLQGAMLLNRIQAEFQEIFHLLALFETPHIAGLAAYLRKSYPADIRRLFPDEDLGRGVDEVPAGRPAVIDWPDIDRLRSFTATRFARRVAPPGPKNRRAVFVLSPPRSGSTLLRVILAGHPVLFAPPELYLLEFESLAERRQAHAETAHHYLLEGAPRALMEAKGWDVATALAAMRNYEDSGMSTRDFYRVLQDAIGERILVDKTPGYAVSLTLLEYAEAIFDDPFYIHLLRHPCGMIHSYDEYRLAEMLGSRYKHPYSTRQQAEIVWVNHHRNILEFLGQIPSGRQLRVRFEDLVADPEEISRGLCAALGLEYEPLMARPYEQKERRMLDGIVAESRMLGDQKLTLKHKAIDPSVADRWSEEMSTDFLGPAAREIAARLGYEIAPARVGHGSGNGDGLPTPPRPDRIERLSRADASAEVMSRVETLSDAEVEALLSRELNDLGAAHE